MIATNAGVAKDRQEARERNSLLRYREPEVSEFFLSVLRTRRRIWLQKPVGEPIEVFISGKTIRPENRRRVKYINKIPVSYTTVDNWFLLRRAEFI